MSDRYVRRSRHITERLSDFAAEDLPVTRKPVLRRSPACASTSAVADEYAPKCLRRLFRWHQRADTASGTVGLPLESISVFYQISLR